MGQSLFMLCSMGVSASFTKHQSYPTAPRHDPRKVRQSHDRGVDAKVCHPSSVASSSFLTLPVAVIGRLPKMRMRGTL